MTIDLSSLFHKSIGFDHLDRIFEKMEELGKKSAYPPYNIVKIEKFSYKIVIALAGFQINNLDITLNNETLVVSSTGINDNKKDEYIYKGIAFRSFEKKFQLAENIKVVSANLKSGLLNIHLKKEAPPRNLPKKIHIIQI